MFFLFGSAVVRVRREEFSVFNCNVSRKLKINYRLTDGLAHQRVLGSLLILGANTLLSRRFSLQLSTNKFGHMPLEESSFQCYM